MWITKRSVNSPAVASVLLFLFFISLAPAGSAQQSADWNGVWVAEGTLFSLGVQVQGGVMKVEKVETLGFEWTHSDGVLDGNTVEVNVEYAGVTGVIQAELVDTDTAVAFAKSCVPEFMVVCALAKDRQAIFRKVESFAD